MVSSANRNKKKKTPDNRRLVPSFLMEKSFGQIKRKNRKKKKLRRTLRPQSKKSIILTKKKKNLFSAILSIGKKQKRYA